MFPSHSYIPAVITALVLVGGGAFFAGVYVGTTGTQSVEGPSSLINTEPPTSLNQEKINFSPFWHVWEAINRQYAPVNASSTEIVNAQEKVWGATQGLVRSLDDPYSVFLPPQDSKTFEENVRGSFGGVGMEIGIRDGILTVVSPLQDTPAERAGIKAGDKIIRINDAPTANLSIDEAVSIIRGEIGTTVNIHIQREGREGALEIPIVRDTITIPTIETEEHLSAAGDAPQSVSNADGVFIIRLFNFSAQSPSLFRESLREFVKSGKQKLILDLRGNAGGFLSAAVDIASWFLPAGKVVVTEDYGDKRSPVVHRSKGYDIFNDRLEMAILVNRGTASAAEILAGALSEHGVATLIGEQTFGKGSVQELIQITNDTSLKLTVAHWKTPQGTIISQKGINPDVVVQAQDSGENEEGSQANDTQMERAIEILMNM